MKINKLWIAIILILVVGCLSTSYTKRYRDHAAVKQTEAAAPAAAKAGAIPKEAAGASDGAFAVMAVPGSVQNDSADATLSDALPAPEAADGERTNGYRNRLKELDARIEKEHASSADTTNSMKAAAEQERKLWETELNRILDALETQLPEEETKALFMEQKEWLRERENIAVESSKKKSGSTLEEVEYNVSLADTTRTRAYELAEQYASVLMGAE